MVEFNKMFVMLPVMFMARKLDGEDPAVVYWLRIAYGCMQAVCVLIVGFVYLQASKVKADRVVYVPAPAVPFADPNAKKKYTETNFNAHVFTTARSLLGSTIFGICLTVGLHYYKGMVMGLAIQTVMGPLNLLENPLIKALFLSSARAFRIEDRIFEEKVLSELAADDEVVDGQGNPIVRRNAAALANNSNNNATATAAGAGAAASNEPKSIQDLLLDTWDAGSKADIGPLMEALDSKNCNTQTTEDHWTPLMILAGLGSKGTADAIQKVLVELKANPSMTDKEGWNAMHWAAFHGSQEGARELVQSDASKLLLNTKDKDGLTPLETAKKEKNMTVAEILEEASQESKKSN